MNILRAEHPNPQCVRDNWVNLNGQWDFSFDNPVFDKKINVPFSWGTEISGIENVNKAEGWYKRTVSYTPQKDNHVHLVLGAVYYECEIFVNASYFGHFTGGFTPIEVDVNNCWKNYEENEIIVRVIDMKRNENGGAAQPLGKKMSSLSGIWQSVWLEERPQTYIESFKVNTSLDGNVTIEAEICGNSDYIFIAKFDGVKAESEQNVLHIKFENPRLWSPDDANLYEGKLILKSKNGIDEISTYFGIREISTARFNDLPRKYITLNGKPIYINACLDHSWSLDGFTAANDADIKKEIEQMKAIGLNALRVHLKIEDPRKLYWADKIGMLVIEDMPVGHSTSSAGRAYYEKLMYEMLKRDYNHPSIFMWVLFNETWGLYEQKENEDGTIINEYTKQTQKWVVDCYNKAKKFDPTRLVDDNSVHDNDRNHTVTDVNSWHLYANGYDRLKAGIQQFTKNSYVGSDFNYVGGEYICGDVPTMNCECGNYWDFWVNGKIGVAGDSDLSWQYKYMMNEFRLNEEICGFVFTEFRDVLDEFNGYYRIDGTPKEFGYEGYVPQMSLKDLHSQDFLAVDCKPMKTVNAGSEVSVPIVISSFSDKHHGKLMFIKWEMVEDNAGYERIISSGKLDICYDSYGCTSVGNIVAVVPDEDCIAKLRIYLIDSNGNCIMRNYVIFDVIGKKNILDIPMHQLYCSGFRSSKLIQSGNKLNCIGDGAVSFTVDKLQIPGYAKGKDINIQFEASSKEELTKDTKNILWTENNIGLYSDRGRNPNGYYQTDTVKYPADIEVKINGIHVSEFNLPDGPADSRGCLSWHYQIADHMNDEAGSYGYICTININEAFVPDIFIVSINSKIGFSVYGRRSGRYSTGIEVKMK